MGCCGKNREAARTASHTQTSRPQAVRYEEPAEVYFKYTGDTALRVRGMFTQRMYYFKHKGAVLAVSGRDAPGMKAVPMLRFVPASDNPGA